MAMVPDSDEAGPREVPNVRVTFQNTRPVRFGRLQSGAPQACRVFHVAVSPGVLSETHLNGHYLSDRSMEDNG